MNYTICPEEIRKRSRNITWGVVLSAALAGLTVVQNNRNPDTYNRTLLWSVVGFLIVANVVNLIRHLRYVRLSKTHRIDVLDDSIQFVTRGELTELQLDEVAAVREFRRGNKLQHIQVLLKNKRGIRLEGYGDLEGLARLLRQKLPGSAFM